MMVPTFKTFECNTGSTRSGEQGWALLGLLLALGVMSIVLASSIVPNVQMQVQRDKEIEMMYRGAQMSEGIARYYNGGALRGLQLYQRPPYGYLTELAKLRDGVTIGVREIKFVRASAMIDPVSNSDWEPVRARDPRIMPFLQAWAAQTLIPIPRPYLDIAGPPPAKSVFGKSPSDPDSPGSSPSGQPPIVNPANPANPQTKPGADPNDPDDDPDDDDINDPLAHLFSTGSPGQSNAPIVGVAPKKKGKSANAYFGLSNYEEWVFLFIPSTVQQGAPGIPQLPNQPGRPPQISN